MKKILVVFLCVCSVVAFSQNRTGNFIEKLAYPDAMSGAKATVTLDRDSRAAIGAIHDASNISGYRICIFFDNSQSGRDLGNVTISQFRSRFPNISSDFTYEQPVYKIYVGHYISRPEANLMLSMLRSSFPKAFIVPTSLPISIFASSRLIQPDGQAVAEESN